MSAVRVSITGGSSVAVAVAQRGAVGATGAAGATGATGATGPAGPPAPGSIPSVANYPFNGSLVDVSGNARDLAGGSPTYAVGRIGSALASSSGSARDNDLLSGGVVTGEYTISFWLYLGSTPAADGSVQVLVIEQPGDLTRINFQCDVGGQLDLAWLDAAVGIVGSTTPDAWHHVCVVVDGGEGTLYVDGVVDGTFSGESDPTEFDPAGEFSVLIVPGTGGARIDDLTVFDSALSATQVAELFGGAAAAVAAYAQPLNANLIAIAALTTTAYGRGLLPMTDAAAARMYLELGALATAGVPGSDGQVVVRLAGALAGAAATTYAASGDLLKFTALAATDKPLVLVAHASQGASTPLFDVRHSNGSTLFAAYGGASNTSYFVMAGPGGAATNAAAFRFDIDGSSRWSVDCTGSASYSLRMIRWGGSEGIELSYTAGLMGVGTGAASVTPSARVHAHTVSTSVVGLKVHGASGQSANLVELWGRSSTSERAQAAETTVAVDNTDATRKYRVVKSVYDTAAREYMRAEADGSAPLVGFGGAVSSALVNVNGSFQCDSIANDTGLAAGTYTPTLTNVANLDASTAYSCQYQRVGNTVTVTGRVDVDPTAPATPTQLGISLPVASNFANANELGGSAFAPGIAGQGAAVLADATNDRATLQFVSSDVTNQAMYFTFSYRVI